MDEAEGRDVRRACKGESTHLRREEDEDARVAGRDDVEDASGSGCASSVSVVLRSHARPVQKKKRTCAFG